MIDLVAKLRLKDDFTKPLQRATKSMNDTAKKTEGLSKSVNKMSGTFRNAEGKIRNTNGQLAKTKSNVSGLQGGFKGLTGGLGGLVTRLNPVALGFGAIATAAAGAYGAVKIFEATVGEAMKRQQSQVVIGAMFNDEQLSKQYMEMLDKIAIDSPVFDSQSMYANSKGFITSSKDLAQLEKMWGLAERMVAIDPAQGVDGAVLALRELFSGDSMSMVERFEMSRDAMNDIKNLSLDEQLSELDKYFNKIGLTTKVIDDMGNSALGMWAQVQERWSLVMLQMGEPSIKVVSEFLGNLLSRLEGPEMQKFADWGANVIKNMLQGLTDSAIALYDWFTALQNDPEFQKRTTLAGKVDFIVADIAERMKEWYDNGGKQKIENFGSSVTESLIGILNNSDAFFALGTDLGASIAKGMVEGIWKSAKETELGWFLTATPEDIAKDTEKKVQQKNINKLLNNDTSTQTSPSLSGLPSIVTSKLKHATKYTTHSNYHGLDYVPYDGYTSTLHKGERILTAQENQALENGQLGGGNPITITGNNFTIREEADIKKVAYELAGYIEREALQIG